MSESTRLIKKYPNRRLYDTKTSAYITLVDVKKLVVEGETGPGGRIPFNTDGGGLCNNHPANRGSMTKVLEAVRQLRGEAHPAVQVKNCDLALAQGTGFQLATRHGSATMIMERE